MLNSGHGGYSSDMSARGRVCLTVVMVVAALTCAWRCVRNSGHGGYTSDMSAHGCVCLTMGMMDTALAVDVCALQWAGSNSDMSARGRVRETVDTALT